MVLTQIYISPANLGVRTNYLLGALNGRYRVKLVSVHYIDTQGNNSDKWIRIISSKLNMAYGAERYYTFANHSESVIQQHGDLDFGGIDLTSGYFDIELIDVATGTQPAHFGGCVLSFDMTPMDGQAP